MLSRPVQSNLNPAPGPLAPLAPTSSRTLELNISLENVFSETKVLLKSTLWLNFTKILLVMDCLLD